MLHLMIKILGNNLENYVSQYLKYNNENADHLTYLLRGVESFLRS